DFYGAMHDGPNRGQPTDRAEVVWDLASASVVDAELAARERVSRGAGFDGDDLLRSGAAVRLVVGHGGEPVPGEPPEPSDAAVLVGIPTDIEAVRRSEPDLALAW